MRTRIADIIEKEGEKILEIGVGTGTQALLLAERGLQIIGIDHSPKMLAIARNKLNLKREEDEKGNETYRHTAGMAIHNDDIIIPQLQEDGYSLEDARDYSIVGCVENLAKFLA